MPERNETSELIDIMMSSLYGHMLIIHLEYSIQSELELEYFRNMPDMYLTKSSGILYTWYMSVRTGTYYVPTCTDLYYDIVCTGTYYLRNVA